MFTYLGESFDSLKAVHDRLMATGHTSAVCSIGVEGVNYVERGLTWRYAKPGLVVNLHGPGSIVGFDQATGVAAPGWAISFRPEAAGVDFRVEGVRFAGFARGGVMFDGSVGPVGVAVVGCEFRSIGSLWVPAKQPWSDQAYGLAGVYAKRVHGLWVERCVFSGLVNRECTDRGDCPEMVHGVYVQDDCSNTTILECSFTRISGDPVRVRDGSSALVSGCRQSFAGFKAMASEWRKDGEAPSMVSVIRRVGPGTLYSGARSALWYTKNWG